MKTLTREHWRAPRAHAPKFWIWTSKIMPYLQLVDLFCPIKKISTLHPTVQYKRGQFWKYQQQSIFELIPVLFLVRGTIVRCRYKRKQNRIKNAFVAARNHFAGSPNIDSIPTKPHEKQVPQNYNAQCCVCDLKSFGLGSGLKVLLTRLWIFRISKNLKGT